MKTIPILIAIAALTGCYTEPPDDVQHTTMNGLADELAALQDRVDSNSLRIDLVESRVTGLEGIVWNYQGDSSGIYLEINVNAPGCTTTIGNTTYTYINTGYEMVGPTVVLFSYESNYADYDWVLLGRIEEVISCDYATSPRDGLVIDGELYVRSSDTSGNPPVWDFADVAIFPLS